MKKFLPLTLCLAALASGAISAQALSMKTSFSACGTTCTRHSTSCGRLCSFCDVTLGDGVNTGVCVVA